MKTRSQKLKEQQEQLQAERVDHAAAERFVSDLRSGKQVEVEQGGPWCPHCQWEFHEPKVKESADLSIRLGTPIVCVGCGRNIIPVLDMREPVQAGAPEDMQAIINSVFEIDYGREWKRLVAEMKLGELRTDYGAVLKALDAAEDNARLAHQVYLNFKVEYEKFIIDSEAVEGAMRSEAVAQLQAEKAAKDRAKTITEADVTAKMAELHPDQFRAVRFDRARFKGAVSHAEQLFERWSARTRSLQAMLSTMRK